QHVRDGIGHRHGLTMVLSRNGSHATHRVLRPVGRAADVVGLSRRVRMFSCMGSPFPLGDYGCLAATDALAIGCDQTTGPSARRRGSAAREAPARTAGPAGGRSVLLEGEAELLQQR